MTVIDCVRSALSIPADHPLDPDASFADNGLDSMDVLQAVMAIERDFKVDLGEADAGITLRQLEEKVAANG